MTDVDRIWGPIEKGAALRQLRKERPDLHKRFMDGELSVDAALKEAGFRPAGDRFQTILDFLRNAPTEEIQRIFNIS